jgi:hypothetical protein
MALTTIPWTSTRPGVTTGRQLEIGKHRGRRTARNMLPWGTPCTKNVAILLLLISSPRLNSWYRQVVSRLRRTILAGIPQALPAVRLYCQPQPSLVARWAPRRENLADARNGFDNRRFQGGVGEENPVQRCTRSTNYGYSQRLTATLAAAVASSSSLWTDRNNIRPILGSCLLTIRNCFPSARTPQIVNHCMTKVLLGLLAKARLLALTTRSMSEIAMLQQVCRFGL